MATRFKDALTVQDDAWPIPDIATALLNACKECLDEGVLQGGDPAVRLIVYQLAHLCNIYEIDHGSVTAYGDLMETCREAVGSQASTE